MATLKQAIDIARQEPDSERSQKLHAAILAGKMDQAAASEGIDLSKFKSAGQAQVQQHAPDAMNLLKGVAGALNPANISQNVAAVATAVPGAIKAASDSGLLSKTVPTQEQQDQNLQKTKAIGESRNLKEKMIDHLKGQGIDITPEIQQKFDALTPEQLKEANDSMTGPITKIINNSGAGIAEGINKISGAGTKLGHAITGVGPNGEQLDPEQRAQKFGESLLDTASGSVEGLFAAPGAVVGEIPVAKDVVGFGMSKLKEGSDAIANKYIESTGIDPNSDQAKYLRDGMNTLSQLLATKISENTGSELGRQKAMDAAKASGDIATYEKLASQKPTVTGELGANAVEGAKTIGGAAAEGVKAVTKGASDFFGEKTGLTDFMNKDAATLRNEKMVKGLEGQNNNLKSVNKAFNENTKNYVDDATGEKKTVTPVDTLSKHEIFPTIEKGSINMGDYKAGTGALGDIKSKVGELDAQIDSTLKNTGKKIALDDLWQEAVDKVKSSSDFKAAGTVESTIAKIDKRFSDYVNSYGDTVDIAELNNIRKVANKDWSPETQDVSRLIGDAARDKVYHATDDLKVKNMLRDQGELLSAKRYAEKLNGTKVKGGKMTQLMARTAGAVVGSSVKELPVIGPLLGVLGGDYIAKALQASEFKSVKAGIKGAMEKMSGQK